MDMNIAHKIKVLRKSRGLSQQQLADALGVQRATVSNYEIGRRSPHLKDLERIAKVLGVPLDYFAVGKNEVNDLVARAKMVFDNPNIPSQEKANVYKEVMRLYLNIDE